MLIETTQLPAEIQEQILELVKKGDIQEVQPKESFIKVRGILKHLNIDGLEYERAIRAEWDREWEK